MTTEVEEQTELFDQEVDRRVQAVIDQLLASGTEKARMDYITAQRELDGLRQALHNARTSISQGRTAAAALPGLNRELADLRTERDTLKRELDTLAREIKDYNPRVQEIRSNLKAEQHRVDREIEYYRGDERAQLKVDKLEIEAEISALIRRREELVNDPSI